MTEKATAAENGISTTVPMPVIPSDNVAPTTAKSRREALRAKLRGAERKLTDLVRSSSGDENSYLGQMARHAKELKTMETEKTELEKELERLKSATGGDEFLGKKMEEIQEGFDKQVKTIQGLQDELYEKKAEIETLHSELANKLRRIIELEFDLETHEIHYTNYASEQFKLGEEALEEIRGDNKGADDKTITPRKAKRLISKLLNDLDDLEARYKEEQFNKMASAEKLRIENDELKTQIEILRMKKGQKKVSDDDSTDGMSTDGLGETDVNMAYLRRRVDTLEAKRTLYFREIERLRGDLRVTRAEADSDVKRAAHAIDIMKIEHEALKAHIDELESAKKKKMFGGKKKEGSNEVFQKVEGRINDQFGRIHRLEAASEIKDRQIDALKKEVQSLRTREIAHGQYKGEKYSQLDADILQGNSQEPSMEDNSQHAQTGGGDPSVEQDLRKQLHKAQQALVKKEQELVIERAKAASTAAGLLARITELGGGKTKSARRPSRD